MNARLVLLLWLCLRFPLVAQVPASLDPPFKVPEVGVTVVSPTPRFLEGLRKHYKLPAYAEDKAVKDKPMIELHAVGGFTGGTSSYFFDPNDTTKIITSDSDEPGQEVVKADSPAALKSLLAQLVLKLRNVKKSGLQLTRKYEREADDADVVILTHHLMTPDRILLIRGGPVEADDAWDDLLGKIMNAFKAL